MQLRARHAAGAARVPDGCSNVLASGGVAGGVAAICRLARAACTDLTPQDGVPDPACQFADVCTVGRGLLRTGWKGGRTARHQIAAADGLFG